MEKERLIFDIGMHKGEDLGFYLQNDAKVIAVDADPMMIELASGKYSNYISENKLVLLNRAVSDSVGQLLDFNLSTNSLWNSLNKNISSRKSEPVETIQVESITLPALMEQFGVPYYCKIDIEGMDNTCLQSMMDTNLRPEFISVETECLAKNEKVQQKDYLQTLYSLKQLGYAKFQLIDQGTLHPLRLCKKFYKQPNQFLHFMDRILKKLKIEIVPFNFRDQLSQQFHYPFPTGASGPYGDYLEGQWYNFEDAEQLIIEHRSDYFNLKKAVSYGFWCDWHATN